MNLKKLLSFEQGRITFFEALTKHPENWQQNPTPLSIVRKMIDKTSLDDKKILVLFNIEFLQVVIEERKINPQNIYYIADNELEFLGGIKIFKVQSYKIKENTVPALKKLIAGLEMKFDLVFSNPPYNGNVDIKILNEIIDVADEFVVVHPSTWALDIKGKTKLFTNFVSKIDGKVESLEFFNGNPIFNIGLFVPCMITHINNNHNSECQITFFDDEFAVKNLSKVTKFGSKWETLILPFITVLQKHIENQGEVWSKRINSDARDIDDTKFYCQLAAIRGHELRNDPSHMHQNDFYTMLMKNSDQNKGVRNLNARKDGFIVFEFTSEVEQNNFISYLKSDFARFCLSIVKNTQNIHYGEMELIPWLDFTEEWDDEKLFKKFDVSQELQDYIRDFLPDYYGIRK
jgi:hypothetical protein